MKSYVLDASVAAKWVLPRGGETLVAESLDILQQYGSGQTALLVPDLFWTEMGNILWKAVRAGRIARSTALAAISDLQAQSLPTAPSSPLLEMAVIIAVDFDRTVYDATYVALAIHSGRPLLTADERLANALGLSFPIRWLGSRAV